MRIVQRDLRLDHLYVVHPGEGVFPLADGISAAGLFDMRRILMPGEAARG